MARVGPFLRQDSQAVQGRYIMDVQSINQTIRDLVDDAAGSYVTDPYIQTKLNLRYTAINNKLMLYNADFARYVIELPSVPAGTPDLSSFSIAGKPLYGLIVPREVEWKLPGQDPVNYRDAEGPIDKLRDIPAPGIAALDCWKYTRFNIQLSRTSTALDLRVTGDFISPPIDPSTTQIQAAANILPVIAYDVAALIAKVRGNAQWSKDYTMDAMTAMDDFIQGLSHLRQGKTYRLARADYAGPNRGFRAPTR